MPPHLLQCSLKSPNTPFSDGPKLLVLLGLLLVFLHKKEEEKEHTHASYMIRPQMGQHRGSCLDTWVCPGRVTLARLGDGSHDPCRCMYRGMSLYSGHFRCQYHFCLAVLLQAQEAKTEHVSKSSVGG